MALEVANNPLATVRVLQSDDYSEMSVTILTTNEAQNPTDREKITWLGRIEMVDLHNVIYRYFSPRKANLVNTMKI